MSTVCRRASGTLYPSGQGWVTAAQDPFVAQGLATVRVVEFRASQKTKDVERWGTAE